MSVAKENLKKSNSKGPTSSRALFDARKENPKIVEYPMPAKIGANLFITIKFTLYWILE